MARNPEFADIGKKAITLRILASESVSKFRERMKNKNLDWYSYLFDRLTDDIVNKNDYIHFSENNNVSFITFNYDRSLEHFLYESLINSFNNIQPEKIKEQLIKLRIIHLFGQVAGLEWEDLSSKVEYQRDVNHIDILGLINNISIIYEGEENLELEEAHKLIKEAQRVFFLGFGYAKENLKLLTIPGILNPTQYVCGTALGVTSREFRDIVSISPYQVHIGDPNWDCLMLLRQYL